MPAYAGDAGDVYDSSIGLDSIIIPYVDTCLKHEVNNSFSMYSVSTIDIAVWMLELILLFNIYFKYTTKKLVQVFQDKT